MAHLGKPGLFDFAEVTLFLLNYADPAAGQAILRKGTIGSVQWNAEGQYRAEARGLFQLYSQIPIRTYGQACDAELGDTRCTVDLAPLTIQGIVSATASRRRFDAIFGVSPEPIAGVYIGGLLTFTTGDNAGYSREVRLDAAIDTVGQIEVAEPFPVEIVPGDEFDLTPGCDKAYATCRDRFDNLANFRGHGVFVPGQNEILKVGGQ